MFILTILALFTGGALAASNLIIARRPNAQQLIDKLLPYQGIIGVVLVISGVEDTFRALGSLGILSQTPKWMLLSLLATAVELGLGFLLAHGLLSRYVLRGIPSALERSERLRLRLAPYQAPLGLTAMVLSILLLFHN